jgi:hypothetical protein
MEVFGIWLNKEVTSIKDIMLAKTVLTSTYSLLNKYDSWVYNND